jgi:type I restriction enzyme, S subunit
MSHGSLPPGWISSRLDEVCSYIQRGKSPRYAAQSELPVVNQRCVRWWGLDTRHIKFIDPSQWPDWSEERILRDGDILWNSTGTGTIGRACFYRVIEPHARMVVDSHITILRSSIALVPKFLFYFVMSPMVQRRIIDLQAGSTNQVELPKAEISAIKIPLAPVGEQARIVSRIDELFSRIEEGERALERVQKLVERYRQSVLKAAATGELTRAWREQRKGQFESGEALLKRILKARREAWEQAELGKMKAKGVRPADDVWKSRYQAPGAIETDYLGQLPNHWQRVRIDAAGEVQLGRQRAPAHHVGDFMRPYLRVANVYEQRFDLSDVMTMNFSPQEFANYRLYVNDILLNEGQSKELVGRPALYKDELPGACFTNTLVRFRATSAVLPQFAILVFLHYMKSGYFQKIAKITTNIAHLGAGRFAEMSFPVPSVQEQLEIVDRVDRQSSVYELLIADVARRKLHVDSLRQSVLKHAFSGRLVDQNPEDESAATHIDRLSVVRDCKASLTARSRADQIA